MPDKSHASDTPKRRGRPPKRRAEAGQGDEAPAAAPAVAAPAVAAPPAPPVAAAPAAPALPPAPPAGAPRAANPPTRTAPPESSQASAPDDRDDDNTGTSEPPRAADPANPLAIPAGKRVVIGVTGEPGAGKSALARALFQLGARSVDADALGHEVIEQTQVMRELVRRFGDGVIGSDGGIDRRKLAALAFESAEATQALNRIVHPELTRRIRDVVQRAGSFVVIDCALLHELGLADLCTGTVYVYAPREQRAERVQARGWDESELARREAALGVPDERRKKCSLAVNNQGNEDQLTLYAKVILAKQLGVDLAALKRAPGPSVDDDADDEQQGSAQPPVQQNAQPPQAQPQLSLIHI